MSGIILADLVPHRTLYCIHGHCSHAVTIGISNDYYLGVLQASVNIDNMPLCTHDVMHCVEIRWGPRSHSGFIQMLKCFV